MANASSNLRVSTSDDGWEHGGVVVVMPRSVTQPTDNRRVVGRVCVAASDGRYWAHVELDDGEIRPTGESCWSCSWRLGARRHSGCSD